MIQGRPYLLLKRLLLAFAGSLSGNYIFFKRDPSYSNKNPYSFDSACQSQDGAGGGGLNGWCPFLFSDWLTGLFRGVSGREQEVKADVTSSLQ